MISSKSSGKLRTFDGLSEGFAYAWESSNSRVPEEPAAVPDGLISAGGAYHQMGGHDDAAGMRLAVEHGDHEPR